MGVISPIELARLRPDLFVQMQRRRRRLDLFDAAQIEQSMRIGQKEPIGHSAALTPSTDVDRALEYLANLDHQLTGPELYNLLDIRQGPVLTPKVLYAAFRTGRVPKDVLAIALSDCWLVSGTPQDVIWNANWSEMFDSVGYIANAKATPRPTRPLRLYRAAPREYARLWSWTASLTAARHLAALGAHRRALPGSVWTTLATPESLKMQVRQPQGAEPFIEHVCDTRGLQIMPVTEDGLPDRAHALP